MHRYALAAVPFVIATLVAVFMGLPSSPKGDSEIIFLITIPALILIGLAAFARWWVDKQTPEA